MCCGESGYSALIYSYSKRIPRIFSSVNYFLTFLKTPPAAKALMPVPQAETSVFTFFYAVLPRFVKCAAFCLFALAGIRPADVYFLRMADFFFVVTAVAGTAVNGNVSARFAHTIACTVRSSFTETGAACFAGFNGLVTIHHNIAFTAVMFCIINTFYCGT